MKLSIIIPCFNIQDKIDKIYNLLSDKLNNKYELIFIDNASTDDTLNLLNKLYEEDTQHIKVISLLNKCLIDDIYIIGLNNSIGEYICLYDINININDYSITKMIDILDNNEDTDMVILKYNCYKKENILYKIGNRICNNKLINGLTKMMMFKKIVKDTLIDNEDRYPTIESIIMDNNFKVYYDTLDKLEYKDSIVNIYKKVDMYKKYVSNRPFWNINILSNILLIIILILFIVNFFMKINMLLISMMLLTWILIKVMVYIGNWIMLCSNKRYKRNIVIRKRIGFLDESIL